MKRLAWYWWLALALLTLIFLLLRLPASLLGSVLASQTGDKLTLAAAEGSIWQGSAQPVLQGKALAERVSWSWQPAGLLRGKLGYQLKLDDGSAQLALGLRSLELREANFGLAAAPLLQLDQRSRGYGLSGQFHLSTGRFLWQAGKPEGQLLLDWRNAASSLVPGVQPLGDYRATVTPAGERWQVQLSTLNGQLQLNGQGNWDARQGLQAEVGLKAANGAEALLAPFLNQVGAGSPESERKLRFNFK
ncbi:type II secretion system protein N [Chitinimonas naiadis]